MLVIVMIAAVHAANDSCWNMIGWFNLSRSNRNLNLTPAWLSSAPAAS